MNWWKLFVLAAMILLSSPRQPFAQKVDTTKAKVLPPIKLQHNPSLATKRSAIIPGWGQAYNKQYWKIPLVYAGLAIPAVTFVFNDQYYKKTKFAYEAVFASTNGNSSLLSQIDKDILRSDGTPYSASTYESARNGYRRNRDYSILYFFLMWGLNVVDATVSGHLKNFDVGSDLSWKLKPSFQAGNGEPAIVGVGFRVSIEKVQPKQSVILSK